MRNNNFGQSAKTAETEQDKNARFAAGSSKSVATLRQARPSSKAATINRERAP